MMHFYRVIGSVCTLMFFALQAQAQFWTQKADIPPTAVTGRWGAFCFSVNNKLYVGGGYVGNFASKKDMWEYTPATNTWKRVADVPGSNNRTQAVAFSINGKGYVGLGSQDYNTINSTFLDDLWEYDAAGDSWVQKASLPAAPRDGVACFVAGNKAYIVGGAVNFTYSYSAETWQYDPATNQWTAKHDYPEDILGAQGFAINNTGYVTGGTSDSFSSKKTYMYDATADNWVQKGDYCGAGRWHGVSFVLDGKAYVGLGFSRDAVNNYYHKEFCRYDPVANSWTPTADYPGTDRAYGVAGVANGKAYAGAGFIFISSQEYLKDWYEFDPNPVGIAEVAGRNDAVCYPNPTTGELHWSAGAGVHSVKVYDMSGMVVLHRKVAQNSVSIGQLPAGNYLVQLLGTNGTMQQTIVKE